MRAWRDRRLGVLVTTAALIAVVGLAARWLPSTTAGVAVDGGRAAGPDATAGLTRRFQQAVTALQAERFADAERTLRELLRQAPRLPEAHVNMGFAQLGLGFPAAAADDFAAAIELRPTQINAYYGLAVALERNGDVRGALGAMRSYVHLTQADDPHLPKARAALWEWEARLATAGADQGASP